MLNRRILRIKAFKVLYSLAENPSLSQVEAEKQLERSCESTRDLYLFLLGIAGPLTGEAAGRIEAARRKFNPTEEDLHPNEKFVSNRLAAILDEDPDFRKIYAKKKFSWDQYDVLLRHIFDSIRTKEWFSAYMNSGKSDLAEDAALWEKIFEEEFDGNEELEAILEDLSIWWNDDLAYALSWCCKAVHAIGKGQRWNLPPLYMSDITKSGDSDRDFVYGIVRKGVASFERYYEMVAGLTPKWDKNRICSTDLALIAAGMAEHEAFPGIPASVTINEFVEISKYYSTPESRGFVNGLLDRLINNNKKQL